MAFIARVVLDTNFLLIPGQFGVDIFEELKSRLDFAFKVQILDMTLDELKSLSQTVRMRDRSAIKLALNLIKSKNIEIVNTKGFKSTYVDDALIELINASKDKIYIATQDKLLKKRIKDTDGGIITLRQKRYIMCSRGAT